MDLETLDVLVRDRAEKWTASKAAWQVVHGSATRTPTASVVLKVGHSEGRLTVWANGEAQLAWADRTTTGAGHWNLASRNDLNLALDVLEIELGLS